MYFNLSNEEYYCQFWRIHFENLFSQLGLTKVFHKNNVEIGHYNFATKIAYGFPNSYARKKFIHLLYKGESYYPKSMLITKKWMMENIQKVFSFLYGSRKILKNEHGVGSKNLFLVNNIEDCFNYMNSKDFYILQNEIDPFLHNGHKIDERVYFLTIKEGNKYSGYMFQEGHIKLTGFKFDKEKDDMGTFATNIKAPKPENSNPEDFTIITKNFLSDKIYKNKWEENRLEIMKKICNKFLPIIAMNTNKYYKNKNQPEFIWHLYGLDILIDKDMNMYLCEFNGKPGVVYETVMPKKITDLNRKILNRIALCFVSRWIDGNNGNIDNDNTIIKLGEFIKDNNSRDPPLLVSEQ